MRIVCIQSSAKHLILKCLILQVYPTKNVTQRITWVVIQRTIINLIRESITVRLVSSLTELDLMEQENMFFLGCRTAIESLPVKLKTSRTVILLLMR